MSCDCEIYEIFCHECAPSPETFEKANRDRDEALRRIEREKEAANEHSQT